jgi:hypothetical protein
MFTVQNNVSHSQPLLGVGAQQCSKKVSKIKIMNN